MTGLEADLANAGCGSVSDGGALITGREAFEDTSELEANVASL